MTAEIQPRRSIVKVALTASAGATIELYDFFVYGTAAALIFPKLFFPASMPPFVAQMAAFSTFAVGFVARPLGGALFGHFGDLFGRKRALVTALLLMGAATALIGFLPSYAQAGWLAPPLLVILRFMQGLALGGQWGGAALLAIESAPPKRQGFYGSFVQIGVPLGVVMANLVFLAIGQMMAPVAFQAWGWRPPFILGAALTGLWAFAFFPLLETGRPELIFLSITVELALLSLMCGPQAALFAELFPVELRYSGASLGYQIGSVVGGGLAPIIATFLYAQYHTTQAIAVYLAVMCAVSLVCTVILSLRARATR